MIVKPSINSSLKVRKKGTYLKHLMLQLNIFNKCERTLVAVSKMQLSMFYFESAILDIKE